MKINDESAYNNNGDKKELSVYYDSGNGVWNNVCCNGKELIKIEEVTRSECYGYHSVRESN